MKICFKCCAKKALSEFYSHPGMDDGHLNKCKDCTKSDARLHREKNLESVRAYDRQRGVLSGRKARNRANYRKRTSTKAGRKREWSRSKEWISKNQVKRAAHIITGNAIRSGLLTKQPCNRCGSKRRIHAHHEDYNRPLDVTWLCYNCHGARHREINQIKRETDGR